MTHDDRHVVAFLNGELSEGDEQAFDQHLLGCEACWRAVREDRAGRLALDLLRNPPAAGLADWVTASVQLADRAPGTIQSGRRRRWPRRPAAAVAAAVAVVAVLGGALGWALGGPSAGDPPQIAGVVAMMHPAAAGDAALQDGERVDLGGQSMTVRAYRVHGSVVLVATSARAFPIPSSSHLIDGSSSTAWMAAQGPVSMYGVNRPDGGGRSMFVVAAMPMAQLPQVAARLHLI